jgi:hypothetical protein
MAPLTMMAVYSPGVMLHSLSTAAAVLNTMDHAQVIEAMLNIRK